MTKKIRSALPVYMAAAAWLICSLIFPPFTLLRILCCAVLAAAAYIVGSLIFPARVVTIEKKITTGNAELDRQIGRAHV